MDKDAARKPVLAIIVFVVGNAIKRNYKMAIKKNGDFVFIQKTSIRISEILSAKPESLVHVDFSGNIVSRDFPKIIVTTNQSTQQFLYGIGDDDKRDADLRILQEIIGSYNVIDENSQKGNTTINITSSTGINIISNSSNSVISQEKSKKAKSILSEMKLELEKIQDINNELKEDIHAMIVDIESQIDNQTPIRRHFFRSLLGITSDFASLSGLVISLGQVMGFL